MSHESNIHPPKRTTFTNQKEDEKTLQLNQQTELLEGLCSDFSLSQQRTKMSKQNT